MKNFTIIYVDHRITFGKFESFCEAEKFAMKQIPGVAFRIKHEEDMDLLDSMFR